MYLDESGCCCESPLVYSYGKTGEQKEIEQNRRKGRRINLMGVWEPNQRMEYAFGEQVASRRKLMYALWKNKLKKRQGDYLKPEN